MSTSMREQLPRRPSVVLLTLASASALLVNSSRLRADCVENDPCDDGSACTENDICTNGSCAGTPIGCDDGNACTTDTCDPQLGCIHTGARTIADENRRLFYNNSFYDSASTACNNFANGGSPCNDNTAIATDKVALNPGETAGTANYISYSRGINGMMIDVTPGPGCSPLPAGSLSSSNFDFRIANSASLGSYVTAPAPLSIEVIPGGGTGGSDRIKIIWPNVTIPNTRWLRTVVKSNSSGGSMDLASVNVFYFGLARYESLTPGSTRVVVDTIDQIDARNHPHNSLNRVPVATNSTSPPYTAIGAANAPDARYDYEKNSTVSASDEIGSRNNITNSLYGLLLLNPAP